MSFNAKVFRVLIASPGDVVKERSYVTKALQEWNNINSESRRIVLLDLKWETHSTPYFGDRPQSIINRDVVDKADCLIGIFWTRIGSPTGVDISGTVEEIKRTHAARKPVLLYFSKVSIDPELIDTEQLELVRGFKKSLYQEGLVDSYTTIEEFGEKFSRHLEDVVKKLSNAMIEEKIAENTSATSENTQVNEIEKNKKNVSHVDASIDELLDEADSIRCATGENVLLTLRSALEDGGEEQFVSKLREVLKSPYLSANDFMSIASMSGHFN